MLLDLPHLIIIHYTLFSTDKIFLLNLLHVLQVFHVYHNKTNLTGTPGNLAPLFVLVY